MRKRVSKKMQTFSFLMASSSWLFACGKQELNQSRLNLTNGIEVDSATFPAVILLLMPTPEGPRLCTGFFVNEHQVLTAAHCVHDGTREEQDIYFVEALPGSELAQASYTYIAKAHKVTVHPDYLKAQGQLANPYDLAVIDFVAGTAPASLRIASQAPKIHDNVTLVGFGSSENTSTKSSTQAGTGLGVKRYGQNTISGSRDGILSLSGIVKAKANIQKGQYVSTGHGDSGSPLLVQNEIVGLTVAGEVRQGSSGQLTSLSYSVDLSSASSRAFLSASID